MTTPFFADACGTGARWDPVRDLSDDVLARFTRDLHELADRYRSDAKAVSDYLTMLVMHPGSELSRRQHVGGPVVRRSRHKLTDAQRMLLLEGSADVRLVQDALGHADRHAGPSRAARRRGQLAAGGTQP